MIFQLNSSQSGRLIAEEAKDQKKIKKEMMVEMKKQPTERLVPYYLIIVPRGQLWWIMDKKEKDKKERNKLQLHHTRIGLHRCSQTPYPGKGENPVQSSQQW